MKIWADNGKFTWFWFSNEALAGKWYVWMMIFADGLNGCLLWCPQCASLRYKKLTTGTGRSIVLPRPLRPNKSSQFRQPTNVMIPLDSFEFPIPITTISMIKLLPLGFNLPVNNNLKTVNSDCLPTIIRLEVCRSWLTVYLNLNFLSICIFQCLTPTSNSNILYLPA